MIPIKTRIRTAAIFVFALALRWGYALQVPAQELQPDSGSYDLIAWNLATDGHYQGADHMPTAYRTPGYVLFLATVYSIAGHDFVAVRLAQGLLGALLVLLIMRLARRVSAHPAVPWIAGGVAAVYPFFIYYDSQILSDAFVTFSAVLALELFFTWRDRPASFGRAAAAGAVFTVLALTKTVFIAFFVWVIAIEAGLTAGHRDRLQKWIRLGCMALVFAAPLLAWGWRNERALGRFTLDTHGGITSVECIMFYDQCKQGVFPEFFRTHPLKQAAAGMGEAESDAFYMKETKNFIRAHPARFLRQALGNTKNFWRLYPRQDIDFKEGRRKITVISLITEPLLLILALIGVIQTRAKWRTLVPLYLFVLVLAGVHSLTTGQMRYRLPVMPLAIVFSAATVAPWIGRRTRL